jgi:hypothetical protein
MLLEAQDTTDVARARAFHEAVRWRAAKEHREVWGDSQVIDVRHSVSLDVGKLLADRLAKLSGRVIDAEVVEVGNYADPDGD